MSFCPARQRGVVVALVLVIIAGISFLGYESMRLARLDAVGSTMLRTRIMDEGLIDAGIQLARELLVQDVNASDGPFDVWNYFPERCERLSLYFTSGKVTGVIEDENGRLAINSLVRSSKSEDGPYGLLRRTVEALALAHGMGGDAAAYADEVDNWVRAQSTALDAKYLALPTPLRVPHREMRSADELLLIQWPGTDPKDVEKLYYGTEQIPGLRDLVSVYAEGPLNMNTADRVLLFASVADDDLNLRMTFTQRAMNFRNNPQNSLGWRWYVDIGKQVKLAQTIFSQALYSYDSKMFRASITAATGVGRRHAAVILNRKDNIVEVRHTAF